MRKVVAAMAAAGIASSAFAAPARAEIINTDAALAGRTFCWSLGWDSEQYGRDHSYVYSYHMTYWNQGQLVLHGSWTISRDGTVTLKIDGGGTLTRRYDINGEHVFELNGTLVHSGGAEGHLC